MHCGLNLLIPLECDSCHQAGLKVKYSAQIHTKRSQIPISCLKTPGKDISTPEPMETANTYSSASRLVITRSPFTHGFRTKGTFHARVLLKQRLWMVARQQSSGSGRVGHSSRSLLSKSFLSIQVCRQSKISTFS